MRRRYRYDPKTKEMYEVIDRKSPQSHGVMVMPDIKPFVSPISGKEITGRKALREHNKQFNVTNTADFTQEWADKAKERAKFFTGGSGYDRERRIEHLKYAYDKHRRK